MFIFHRTRAHFHRLPRGPCADARSPTLGHSVFLYDGHSRIQLTGLLILYQGLDYVDVTGLTMIKNYFETCDLSVWLYMPYYDYLEI